MDDPLDDSCSNTETESDDDMEPAKLVEKYISLQSSLCKLQPEMVQFGNQRRRGLKSAAKNGLTKTGSSTPRIARIVGRIKRIQSDILFDQDEADNKWRALQNDLAKEVAERKRLHLDSEPSSAGVFDGDKSSGKDPHFEVKSTSVPSTEDTIIMVGDLFSAVPDSSIDTWAGTTKLTSTEPGGTTGVVKDYGKWSGQSPRRIFEEACKARYKYWNIRYQCHYCLYTT